LQKRGHANPWQERQEPISKCRAQKAPDFGAEGANDPTADHVQAPQEQSDPTDQVEKDNASHD
jgi:hypothetical protein